MQARDFLLPGATDALAIFLQPATGLRSGEPGCSPSQPSSRNCSTWIGENFTVIHFRATITDGKYSVQEESA